MSATKPINRAPQCSLRLVSQRRAGVTEIKAAKPKDGRLSGGVPGGAVTQAAAGAQGLPSAGGGSQPAPPDTAASRSGKEESEREALLCPLRVPSGTDGERRNVRFSTATLQGRRRRSRALSGVRGGVLALRKAGERGGNFACSPEEKTMGGGEQRAEHSQPSVTCGESGHTGTREEVSGCGGVGKEGQRCPCSSQCVPATLHEYTHTNTPTNRTHTHAGKDAAPASTIWI